MQAKHAMGADFEAALGRAVQSGAVVVAAAGNDDGHDQPAYPALYAADPRFAGAMLVAGAATFKGDMAAWSDPAGATQARYVLAPGEWVLTNCRELCDVVSGTSYSAPYVAGAVALLMEAHPELSGPEVADRVLKATRDMGPPGVDAVYGHGMLDLSHAFETKRASR
jgi:subtilisin family serine protease